MRVINSGLVINTATTPTISDEYINNSCDIVSLEVKGTFTSATVKLQGMIDPNSTEWVDLAMINMTDYSTFSAVENKGIFEGGIEGVLKVRVNVTAVSGGNVSVYARFGNTSAE